MAKIVNDISINTLIGSGSRITGDISINGFLRVDGDIAGTINTDGPVMTSSDSRIKGNITAQKVTIGGVLYGNITARAGVKLLRTSVVTGRIVTQNLSIETGCIFNGRVLCATTNDGYATLLENHQNEIHKDTPFIKSSDIK